MTLRAAFAHQADNNEALGSPFTARILRLVADRLQPASQVADRMFAWDGDIGAYGASLPLRFLGGLHALVLTGAAPDLVAVYPPAEAVEDDRLWQAIETSLTRHADLLNRWLDNPPQTNEIRRASVMIAAGHLLTQWFGLPLKLSELGASAGLNLNWDRYALDLPGTRFGPYDPVLTLTPEWQGPLPPHAPPQIRERRGVDINPLDPHDPADALRLTSYIWADQPERLAPTRAAISAADAPVDRADAADWLENRLAEPSPGCLHLVCHTIAWQYFPPETQARCSAALARAGEKATLDAPLAHLAMEADGGTGAGLSLTLWPAGEKLSLGRVDFHGRWVKWRANSTRTTLQEESKPMTDTPMIAQKAPYPVEVEEGKNYFWCACGKSSKQPFCDGSHKGSEFSPVKYTAEATRKVFFCGCKHTGNAPLCDGSHKDL